MLSQVIQDWKYRRRLDPEVFRKRRPRKRDVGLWFIAVEIDLKCVLRHRGGRDPIIETYLRVPRLIRRSTSTKIGEEIQLTFEERWNLGITSLRPYDMPWRECRRRYKQERNRRKRERAALLRRKASVRPLSESLSRTKPWEAEGISRSTWYKRRKQASDNYVPPPSIEDQSAPECPEIQGSGLPVGASPVTEPIADQSFQPREQPMKELRPYQADAIENLRSTLRQGVRRIVLQAPTGAGKTRIASEIVSLAREKKNRVAFVVPAISLVDQTVESFYSEGIREIGVIQANHDMTDWCQPVQVCSIQTIQSRKAYPACNIAIFDECHRLFEAHKTWLQHEDWQKVPFIGLSATPWAKGLGKYFETLLKVTDTESLIDLGYLSKFRVFATGHPDLAGVRTVAGDYHEGDLSNAMQAGELTADIVKTYKEKWGKGKTLCFAVDKAHARSIQERFEFAGISCGYQDAETPNDERREIKNKFHAGEYEVVANIQTLTTGVDWDVRCLILARPTRSEMLYVQIIGRALRTADGKEDALILDHSDTTARLGFVTDISHDHLDDGKPNGKAAPHKPPLPKECSVCAYLKPPKMRVCPNCGNDSKPVCAIVEQEGELVEIVPGKLAKVGKKKEWSDQEKRVFLAELKGYAADKAYKPGWASMKYKEKFGEFPPRWMEYTEPARVLSPGVALWIKSRQIAWAKSKRNQENVQ